MKLTDKIPGKQISFDENDKIAKQILLALNPNNLSPLELWNELTLLDKNSTIQIINNCLSNNYYLMYTYYSKKTSYRVFLAEKKDVVKFINDNFDEEWDDGIDIIIVDLRYETIIMGNHDGVLLKR